MNPRATFSKLIIYTLGMALLVSIINFVSPFFNYFSQFTWIALAFFAVLTALSLYIGLRGLQKQAYGFVASVNGVVLIKLFLSILLVLIYVMVARPNSPSFIIPFFFFYIVYTIFEVRELILVQRLMTKATSKRI
ncbi:MAG: hypothetical protein H0V61_00560 [Chitinophagales bacterium]|jgi:hypothetical protein|nr:hypothetical protein [Chitinophagales bacterium]